MNAAEKQRVRIATRHAWLTSKITRQPCEVCGEVKVQAHHPDYARPLEVRWLCRTHHGWEHPHMSTLVQPTKDTWINLRQACGLTTEDAERRMGWKRGHLSWIERGIRPTEVQEQEMRRLYFTALMPKDVA